MRVIDVVRSYEGDGRDTKEIVLVPWVFGLLASGVAVWDSAVVISTTGTLGIDPSSSVALHEQVASAIRRAIADGEAQPGERLPPARDLAVVLGVNSNTVFRALRTLRDEGLLEFRRGRGVTVSGAAPGRSLVISKARELVALAQRCGYGLDELDEIMRQVG